MSEMATISALWGHLGGLLLLAGAASCLISVLGVLRFTDLFMRIHAVGISAIIGTGLILIAAAIHFAAGWIALWCLLIVMAGLLVSPVATHGLALAAYHRHEDESQQAQDAGSKP